MARGLGLVARRIGQPAVVGELAAGLIVGPSLLGRIAPDAAAWLFPGDELHSGVLLAIAWVGVILLLAETGFETDLGLLSRMGRSTALVPVGSLIVPLGMGIGMGFLMPDAFVSGGRTIFALFMGVCLAVSSLPVVAKILIELNLMRRNVGQIIIVAGMADDIVGWVLLSALAGAAASGHLDPAKLGLTIIAIAAFLAFAFTLGQRGTNALLRRSMRSGDPVLPLSAVMLVVFGFAALTQAIGIEAVFGAFVAGIVVARSRFFRRDLEEMIHGFSHGVFAPIFFATAGMYVDLGQLRDPQILLWSGIVLAVASVAKLVGSYVGARIGPLGHREAIAVGVGLNARGALEVIIATIALSIGVFNGSAYTVIVLLAMSTSIAAPPLLRWALARVEATAEEAERLEREELLSSSVIAGARNALLPTRGGANSAIAAHLLDRVLLPEAHVTVLTISDPAAVYEPGAEARVASVVDAFPDREVERRNERADDPVSAIIREADVGYDLMAVGLNEDFRGTHVLSPRLRQLLLRTSTPVLLVRRGTDDVDAPGDPRIRRILVPATGTPLGRAAEELASILASRVDGEVHVVHVVTRDGQPMRAAAVGQLSRARDLAERMGRGASPLLRTGAHAYEEIVRAADDRDVDVIMLGAQIRGHGDVPFLGQGTEYVLERSRQTVAVVLFPDSGEAS